MNASETVPGLEGPDYVTLLIEWNDDDNATTVVRDREPKMSSDLGRKIATAMGALVAIALASWGIRHLRPS